MRRCSAALVALASLYMLIDRLKPAALRRKEVNRLIDLTKTKIGLHHFIGRVNLSQND